VDQPNETTARAASIAPTARTLPPGVTADTEALPLAPRSTLWFVVMIGLGALGFAAVGARPSPPPPPPLAAATTASEPAIPPPPPLPAATTIAVASAEEGDHAAPGEDTALAVAHLVAGRVPAAIVAAARATAKDPTDGQAWLVLGAAHEERGSLVEARRCYAACVEQARRGPRTECAALLER